MQTQWYGDNRDVVKWGTLVYLCKEHAISTILQVPFLLNHSGCGHALSVDGQSIELPLRVWNHFRDLHHIERLGKEVELNIQVFPELFDQKQRQGYIDQLCSELSKTNHGSRLVFLDPDTGIEPKGRPNSKHVRVAEIQQVWQELKPRDWLVVYQHRPQRIPKEFDWLKAPRSKFENACGGAKILTFQCESCASDVALFAAEKLR